jgi:hypothetical protein
LFFFLPERCIFLWQMGQFLRANTFFSLMVMVLISGVSTIRALTIAFLPPRRVHNQFADGVKMMS